MVKKIYPHHETAALLKNFRGPLEPKAFAAILSLKDQTYYRYERGDRRCPDAVLELAKLKSVSEAYNKDRGGTTQPVSVGAIYKDTLHGVVDQGFKVSEALTMAARVLESRTSYALALFTNIQHFDRAIQAEARISDLERLNRDQADRLTKAEARIAALEDKLKLVAPQADPEESAA